MKTSCEPEAVRGIHILIVDDHAVVRDGLISLLGQQCDFRPIHAVGDVKGALAALRREPPDVVVVDLSLGNMSGLDLIKTIRCELPQVGILVLSMLDEVFYAERCLRAGALGYVMKTEGHEKVTEAIRQVHAGKSYLSNPIRDRLWREFMGQKDGAAASREDRLTDRELEVYALIGEGFDTDRIARGLGVSPKTVQTYRNNIKEKLGIETASELVHRATLWDAARRRSPE